MKLLSLCLLFFAVSIHACIIPGPPSSSSDDSGYNRRVDAEEVQAKLISWWSDPVIRSRLSEEMKPQIEVRPNTRPKTSLPSSMRFRLLRTSR